MAHRPLAGQPSDHRRPYPYAPAGDPLMLPEPLVRLRADQPVAQVETAGGQPVWLVTRYEDARAVLADLRFSRDMARDDVAELIPGVQMPSSPIADPPAHTRWRRLVTKAFTPRQVERMRVPVQTVVDELLDRVQAGGRPADLMGSLAFPLPLRAVCTMLDMDVDQERFRSSVDAALSADPAAARERGVAFAELVGLAGGVIAHRRGHPGEDLLSRLIEVRDDDEERLSDEEVLSTVMTLLIGGYENPAHQIGKAVYTLLVHPEQLARLRDGTSTTASVVEETLRYTGALDSGFGSPRYATADVEVGGTVVPRGATVLVLRQSANRDHSAFEDPDRFDVDRAATPHVTFGHGPHHCIGAALARLELEIALEALFRRFEDLRLAVPPADVPWTYRVTTAGPRALPVTW